MRWFAVYTAVLIAISAASLAVHEWSIAATTIAITVVFALYVRRLWRKR